LAAVLAPTLPGRASAASASAQPPTAPSATGADPWARLATDRHVELGDRLVEVPAEGLDAWRRARRSSALGALGHGASDRPLDEVLAAAVAAARDGELAWERALNAAEAGAGRLSTRDAVRVDAALRALAEARGAAAELQARRELVRALVVGRGVLAAVLDAGCMPTSGPALQVFARLVALESATPAYRLAALSEQPEVGGQGLPAAGELAPVAAEPAVRATLVALDALHPRLRLAPTGDGGVTQGCDVRRAALVASLPVADDDAWSRRADMVTAVAQTWGIPWRWRERAAVAAYARGDGAAAALLAQPAPDAVEGGPAWEPRVGALAAGAAKDRGAMAERAEALVPDPGAAGWWIRAEAARQRGQLDAAERAAGEAIRLDPWFAYALITRAMARVAAGRSDEALPDLSHLRLLHARHPVYGPWVERLDARLRVADSEFTEPDEDSP
jgi:tetratricopeptide (TPR) repeat protein